MPNRIIREGVLTSDRVNIIADEPATEVFYRRLHSVVDDFGRYFANPSLLRAALYPLRLEKISDAEVSHHAEACEAAGLIQLYRVGGKPYLELFDFRQRTRAMKSKFPAPDSQADSTGQPGAWHPATVCQSDDGRPQAETETETETEACADGAMPLDAFFEERYKAHPKKRDRNLAEHALAEIAGIETRQKQEEFRRGHTAWVSTDDYQRKGGAFAPTFAVFIGDRTWEYPPSEPAKTEAGPIYVPWKPPTAA